MLDIRSSTQSAASLGLTRSPVSAQIARLEAGRFSPSRPFGKPRVPDRGSLAFRGDVEEMLSMIDDLGRIAEQIRSGKAGALMIASYPSFTPPR